MKNINHNTKFNWFFINVILFAAYPVLYVFEFNQQYLNVHDIFLPILIIEIFIWIIWVTVFIFYRSVYRASFVASLSVVWFFTHYFPFNTILNSLFVTNQVKELIILSTYALFPLIFFLGIYISDKKLRAVNNFLNITAVILCIFSIYSIVSYQVKAGLNSKLPVEAVQTEEMPEVLPDIYYIIPDAHARSDILEELYDIDNSDFINFLKDRGFYLAEKSYTNYPQTILSLSSSLNMEYHEGYDRKSRDAGLVIRKIHDNIFQKKLEALGYKTYSFATGASATEKKNVDYYLGPKGTFNDFHKVLLRMTPLSNISIRLINYTIFNSHRSRILYTFENLPEVVKEDGPKFVIAHIVSPHFPFVFDQNGREVLNEVSFILHNSGYTSPCESNKDEREYNQKKYSDYYGDQLIFIDKALQITIDKILINATRPSIIILQADHGPSLYYNYNKYNGSYLKERFAILNAYYFFDKKYDDLYQSISPVNTFRVISNQYFGDSLELLPDKSYNTLKAFPYAFIDITDNLEDKLLK